MKLVHLFYGLSSHVGLPSISERQAIRYSKLMGKKDIESTTDGHGKDLDQTYVKCRGLFKGDFRYRMESERSRYDQNIIHAGMSYTAPFYTVFYACRGSQTPNHQ